MEREKRTEKKTGNGIDWSVVLPVGECHAISAGELTRRLGFNDARETRRAVACARLDGVPVCSLQRSEKNGGGYFLPDLSRLEEVEHVANELKKRAFTSLLQVKQLNKWIKEHNGRELVNVQMSIDDFIGEMEK
jgi:hypothetical protein